VTPAPGPDTQPPTANLTAPADQATNLTGGLTLTATAMVAITGDIYYGLWYPIVVAVMTLVIGTLFLKEVKHRDIHHN